MNSPPLEGVVFLLGGMTMPYRLYIKKTTKVVNDEEKKVRKYERWVPTFLKTHVLKELEVIAQHINTLTPIKGDKFEARVMEYQMDEEEAVTIEESDTPPLDVTEPTAVDDIEYEEEVYSEDNESDENPTGKKPTLPEEDTEKLPDTPNEPKKKDEMLHERNQQI